MNYRSTAAVRPRVAAPPVRPAPGPIRVANPPVPVRRRLPWQLKLVYTLWFVEIYAPQFWVASFGPRVVLKVSTLLYGLLLLAIIMNLGRMGSIKFLMPPLALFLLATFIPAPFADNLVFARDILKLLINYYILAVGSVLFVRQPRDAVPILSLLFFQYLWWGVHARTRGLVSWHPTIANADAYGPQMVIGSGFCFYMSQAARSRKLRRLGIALAAVCVLGIVTAIARGAALSAGLVALYVLARSPRKGRTALALAASSVIVVVGSAVLFPNNAFWREMRSSFTEGTTKGTGSDRAALWRAAMVVWRTSPVFGVGPANFGPVASRTFQPDDPRLLRDESLDRGGGYSANPGRLYNRSLHSIYFQILSEEGLLGVLAFCVILGDFWIRNTGLRTRHARTRWLTLSGGQYDIKFVALGLEVSMLAYLSTGFFYDQLYVNWLYSIVIVNYMLSLLVKQGSPRGRRGQPAPQQSI